MTDLPEIKLSKKNQVPAGVTPERLVEFVRNRVPRIDPQMDKHLPEIAKAYATLGNKLGVRWDHAFFHALTETNNLSFKTPDGKPMDMKPGQLNFGGLGATGKGEQGESFKDVATGVKAHLQHLLLYAGDKFKSEDLVAERTRKVQEWGVLDSWQAKFKRPITYADMAAKWVLESKNYLGDLRLTAAEFKDFKPDTGKAAAPAYSPPRLGIPPA